MKPCPDPRRVVKVFKFVPNIKTFADVKEGMILPCIVNDITAFGCFVDLGIKQSGLIHIFQLRDGFVGDVNEVVNFTNRLKPKF